MLHLTLEKFLSDNGIADEDWVTSGLDWTDLLAIGQDHVLQRPALEQDAEYFAKTLQRFNKVHTVRWRIKDAEHLMAKIVRKRLSGNPKYADITVANYGQIIDDLIGLRALHLFKADCFVIDERVRKEFGLAEEPIAYVREGDDVSIGKRYVNSNFMVKNHEKGYRSVHYIVATQLGNRKVKAELQVRTIIEEAWSEIDHTIRYPNFSDDPNVASLLTIFNRVAGSADELGGFALALKEALEAVAASANAAVEEARASEVLARSAETQAREAEKEARAERDATFAKLDNALKQLAKSESAHAREVQLSVLTHEVEKLKNDEVRVRAAHSDPVAGGISSLSAVGQLRVGGLIEQMEAARVNMGLSALAVQYQTAGQAVGARSVIDQLGYVNNNPVTVQDWIAQQQATGHVAGPLSVQISAAQQAAFGGSLWTEKMKPVASSIGARLTDRLETTFNPIGTQAWALQDHAAMDVTRSLTSVPQISANFQLPQVTWNSTAQSIGVPDTLLAFNALQGTSAASSANKFIAQQQAVGRITGTGTAADEVENIRRTLDIASGKFIK